MNAYPWYKNALFYEVYVRAFKDSNADGHGDLRGLTQKLDYLQQLGIDCIWLLPIYASPLKDDGYDIADYYAILPEYGTLEDFILLVEEVHRRGMRLLLDLVLNHTSDQHPWFQAACKSRRSPYREYYVWSDSDQKYSQARVIFCDTEKSNWTWDEAANQYYWHRFYASQPDLNYDNPAVQEEMIRVMQFWLDLGVDGFRADAVPYLFEREGTNCENLPETHAYLKKLRAWLDINYPGRILLCEANQLPHQVREYFGDGDEFQMGFHFPLMPRIFMALKKEKVEDLVNVLQQTPALPEICQWCTFLRNHDELTLEMVSEAERQWMWEQYAPDPQMRLNLGIRRRLAPLLDNDPRRISLAFALLYAMPGSPIIYYGDEIGMGDNIALFDRNGVRTPMQWTGDEHGGFSQAQPAMYYAPIIQTAPYHPAAVNVADQLQNPNSLLNTIRRLNLARKKHLAFGLGDFAWLECGSNAVAACLRTYGKERIIGLHNLSASNQPVHISLAEVGIALLEDILQDDEKIKLQKGELRITLTPYQVLWLKGE